MNFTKKFKNLIFDQKFKFQNLNFDNNKHKIYKYLFIQHRNYKSNNILPINANFSPKNKLFWFVQRRHGASTLGVISKIFFFKKYFKKYFGMPV